MKEHYELDYENPEFLTFRNSDDEPIWYYMMRLIVGKYMINLASEKNPFNYKERENKNFNAISCLGRMALHNLLWVFDYSKRDIVYYVPTRNAKLDGKFYNQYSDYFALLYPNRSLTLENAPTDWTYNMPRVNNDVFFYAPNLAISTIMAKFKKKEKAKTRALVEFFDEYIYENCDLRFPEKTKEEIVNETLCVMEKTRIHAKWLVHQCKKHKSKLFVMVGGIYPYYFAINHQLKKAGIKTADLQHGYIAADNSFYNTSKNHAIDSDRVMATPNYLLTYGNYWMDNTNFPFDEKIAIGNPYRNMRVENFNNNKKRTKILLIGCNHNTEGYINFGNEIQKKMPEFEVVFRPHPSERLTCKEIMPNMNVKCVIDYDADLYKELEETDTVISEFSTVMFEAEGLVNHVFDWDTQYRQTTFKTTPFECFRTVDELADKIRQKSNCIENTERFYIKDCKKAFAEFIEKAIG